MLNWLKKESEEKTDSIWEIRNAEINLQMDAKLVNVTQSKKM